MNSKCSHGHDHSHDRHDHGGHGHGHGTGDHHHHVPKDFGWRFAIGASLNMIFVVAELIFGFVTKSLALLGDAVHNLSDVIGLILAWGAIQLAKSPPTKEHTYGYRGASIVAALANAALLFLVTGALLFETVQRFRNPTPVASDIVIIVACIGIAINAATALLFWKGQKDDINIRGAFLHMAADALVSLGVVVAALIMKKTGWYWVDPVIGLMIAGAIFWSTWGFALQALKFSMAAVPPHIDAVRVRAYLSGLQGVKEVHDLHIWPMSTTETALTAHLVIPAHTPDDRFIQEVTERLEKDFKIGHATIQIEVANTSRACKLSPDDVV